MYSGGRSRFAITAPKQRLAEKCGIFWRIEAKGLFSARPALLAVGLAGA